MLTSHMDDERRKTKRSSKNRERILLNNVKPPTSTNIKVKHF